MSYLKNPNICWDINYCTDHNKTFFNFLTITTKGYIQIELIPKDTKCFRSKQLENQ